jgi:hypothetical protein
MLLVAQRFRTGSQLFPCSEAVQGAYRSRTGVSLVTKDPARSPCNTGGLVQRAAPLWPLKAYKPQTPKLTTLVRGVTWVLGVA